MDQQNFWKQRFARYLKEATQPVERKLLDQFFEEHQTGTGDIWSDMKESPEQVRRRILQHVKLAIRPTFTERFFRLSFGKGIAATVVMLLGVGYFFFTKEEPVSIKNNQPSEVEWQSFHTKAAEQKKVMLPDGSAVHLNYQSSIRFKTSHFGQKERKVYLEGEAFFEIQKDSLHPFYVETAQLTTRVLGTSFNINTQDKHIEVAVASGTVEVSTELKGQTKTIRLKPNEGALLNTLNKHLIFIDQISEEAFLWRDGILIFKALPLGNAITRLERAYGVHIQCEPDLLDRSITARYQHQSITEVLDDLCFLLGAKYEITANRNISITFL